MYINLNKFWQPIFIFVPMCMLYVNVLFLAKSILKNFHVCINMQDKPNKKQDLFNRAMVLDVFIVWYMFKEGTYGFYFLYDWLPEVYI